MPTADSLIAHNSSTARAKYIIMKGAPFHMLYSHAWTPLEPLKSQNRQRTCVKIQVQNDGQIRRRGRTCYALLKVGVGHEGAVEARADAELAEDLVLPDVRHVMLTQRVQRRPHVHLPVERARVANRARCVRGDVPLHVHHHCTSAMGFQGRYLKFKYEVGDK